MKVNNIMGMDVSKLSLDCHLYTQQKSLSAVSNSVKGFKSIVKWLKKELNSTEGLLVVMEYTGIYTYGIERFLAEKQIAFVKRPALDIQRSVGMVRGKSDRADAQMISKYGWLRKEELQPIQPLSDLQMNLQQLMSYRDKLVANKTAYQVRMKELQSQMGPHLHYKILCSHQYLIDILLQEIKEIEAEIKSFIQSDVSLQHNYELVSSVTGVGFATAVHLLIATENFTRFSTSRKLVCYCGVAPFEHRSGTSIRGKTRVSFLANRKLKSLLTMAAFSAIQHDPQLKAKYEQKLKQGKPRMSVVNIIRVKLIERIFAVIKNQTTYQLRVAA